MNTDVARMTARRNDDQWAHDLASEDAAVRDDAVGDLRDMLCRGLAKSLPKSGRVDEAFLEDVVQETCMKILEKLDTFQGRSKFQTWAVTIAVRTAVSKMRRRDWQNVSLESMTAGYKLLHDARKKLRRGLEESGFTVEDVREAWA
jgi:RNA polymerase sigma-70 factor (ECF subfamily)